MSRYYFLSDVHLGLQVGDPQGRERRLVAFLDSLGPGTGGVFLLGDLFDFWYEYKYVIPRGYTRVLGALARLTDRGIPVHFFAGNHDCWTFGFLENEIGLIVHRDELYIELDGKHFLLAHGDLMGRVKPGYRVLQTIFRARFPNLLFRAIHPRWAFSIASEWSRHNRLSKGIRYEYKGEEEPSFRYAAQYPYPVDYCIIGHIHSPARCRLPKGGELIVLGDWVSVGSSGSVRADVGIFGGAEEGKVEVIEAPVVVHLD